MNSGVAFWLILAVMLAIIEASTVNMVTIWPAISALITSVFAATGIGATYQAIIFIVVSGLLLIFTRRFVKNVLIKKTSATNADRIIGAEGIVIEKIDAIENLGQVKVMGQIWSAKTLDGTTVEEGTKVIISSLDGVKVVVSVAAE